MAFLFEKFHYELYQMADYDIRIVFRVGQPPSEDKADLTFQRIYFLEVRYAFFLWGFVI